jgi:GntR family transcriptional regulator, transcriptional repressor for pyruvate dehydrogenase complex
MMVLRREKRNVLEVPSSRRTATLNTETAAPPVKPAVATHAVINHVRNLIFRGELVRGQRLPPERDLVRQIGVSRTSVRAGLQALAAKGILVVRHGAGTFVADGPLVLDSEKLHFLSALHGFTRHEMFEARQTLEVGVAGMAATRATGDDLAVISDSVTGMFANVNDPHAFLLYDIRFHRAVADASGNPILASIVEMVAGIFYEARRQTVDRDRDLLPIAEKHRRIYQAIRRRDRSAAELEMFDHLREAERAQDMEVGESGVRPTESTPS